MTLYVAGLNSRAPGHHGPGPKLSIMAHTPDFARSTTTGRIPVLCPNDDELELMQRLVADRKAGLLVDEELVGRYRALMLGRLDGWLQTGGVLEPDKLRYRELGGVQCVGHVAADSTLYCTCSLVEAQAGRCHRSWVAPVLRAAGWDVVLDGVQLA